MFARALGIKIATAVLATSLAVGGVVAGAHNAGPAATAPVASAARTAQIEGAATAARGSTPQPAPTVATAPATAPPAQPAQTAPRPQRPLAWLLPFLRPNPPRPAANPSNVGGAGGAGGQPAPKTAVTGHSVGGLVLSVTGNKVLLRRQNGSGDAQVIVRPGTVIRERGKDVPIGDVRPGDRIVVIGVPQRDGSLAAQAMVVYPRARPATKSTPRPKSRGQ